MNIGGDKSIGMARKIRVLLVERGMSIKDLSDKLGTSSQNLGKKLKRDNFSENDLHSIAEACSAEFVGEFRSKE